MSANTPISMGRHKKETKINCRSLSKEENMTSKNFTKSSEENTEEENHSVTSKLRSDRTAKIDEKLVSPNKY